MRVIRGTVASVGAGQEPRDVYHNEQGDVKTVAKARKAGCLAGAVAVEHPGQGKGLVGDDTQGLPAQPGKAGNHIVSKIAVDLKKSLRVYDPFNDRFHVVNFIGAVGYN